MGHQQLSLIALGVVIVGIATLVGVQIFSSSAEGANIDQTTLELLRLVNRAQEYYARPKAIGGGGKTFTGFSIPADFDTTENAYYTITRAAAQIITLLGTCRTAEDVTVEAVIHPTSHTMVITTGQRIAPGCGTTSQ